MDKWSFILTLFLLPLCSLIYAQTTDLDIETTVPDSIVVCGDSAFFTVEITNTTATQMSNLIFNPKMIQGMIYIPGSVTGMLEHNIAQPNEPLFALSTIDAGETIYVTFYAKAECSIISQVMNLGGNAASAGLANNSTRIDYMNGSVPLHSVEINGSDSYNILYADIFISTIANQSVQTTPGSTYPRHISVQNGGLGAISWLTILIDVEPGVAVSGTNIGSFNGSGQVSVTFGPSDFALFGDGDGYFELDEVLNFTDTVTMLDCIGGQTTYTAFWGCSLLDTCQQDQAFANTILVGGQPRIQSEVVGSQPSFFGCTDTASGTIEYTNIGTESAPGGANYYNVEFEFLANAAAVDFVDATIGNTNLLAAGVPSLIHYVGTGGSRERTRIYLEDFFTVDPDGAGGLEDLDNDGFYDDLAGGASLLVTYNYLLNATPALASCPAVFNYLLFREYIRGKDNCGLTIHGETTRAGIVEGAPNGGAIATGPADVFDQDTATFGFNAGYLFSEAGRFRHLFPSSFISMLNCDSGEVVAYLTLEPGFSVVPNSATVNGVPTTYTITGNIVRIEGGVLNGKDASNQFYIDLAFDCANNVSNEIELDWKTVLSCGCGSEINLGCQTQVVVTHCPGAPCFRTTDFVMERTTMGWTDATQTTLVTPSTPGVALDRAYQCDSVCAYAPGIVGVGSGLSIDSALVRIWYQAAGTDPSFNEGRAEWHIYDVSTGNTFVVPAGAPTATNNSATRHYLYYNASAAIANTIGTLDPGDSLNLKAYVAVNKTNDYPLGVYQFPLLRAQHSRIVNGDTLTCTSLGTGFTVLKTKTLVQNGGGGNFLSNFRPCEDDLFWYRSEVIGGMGTVEDFPNEFRPVNIWNDTLSFTLPQGVAFVPNTVKFDNTSATGSAIFDPVSRTVTLVGSNLFAGGWPIQNRLDDAVRRISFEVSRSCDVPIGIHDVPSEYGYIDYASAPSAGCQEFIDADKIWRVRVQTPVIKMDALLPTIEGFESELEWTIRLCNNGNRVSDESWMYINDLSGNLTIADIISVNAGNVSLPFTQSGNDIYVNTGAIPQGACIDVVVRALNSNCIPGQMNDLQVYSGWSCAPGIAYDPTACHTDTIPLHYITRTANLQTQTSCPPNNLIDICTPFDFDILLISSLEANMDEIEHYVELPIGLTIQPGATYEYPLGTTPQPLPPPTNLYGSGTWGWDLSALVPGLANGFIGTRDTTRNKLRLHYSLVASCDFDPFNLVKIHSNGRTNCGELVDLNAQKKLNINGLPPLDTTKVTLGISNTFANCVNQLSANVNVTNISIDTLHPMNVLEVLLPAGVDYVMGSYSPNPNITPQVGGTTSLEFLLPHPMPTGGMANYAFGLEIDETVACGPYDIVSRTVFRDSAFCASINDDCEISATTGSDTATVVAQALLDAAFTTNVIQPCINENFMLTGVTTCGTHFWDFGDGNTSTNANPTHTYAGPTMGNYTITHIVTGGCGADTSTMLITVVNQCCMLNLTVNATPVGCNEGCDGTATAIVSNGTAPYNYVWGNGASGATIVGLCGGTYIVTVTDANGCTATTTGVVTTPAPIVVNVTATTDETCAGNDGTATLNAIGGAGAYTFNLANFTTGATYTNTTGIFAGLTAGLYVANVIDTEGCEVDCAVHFVLMGCNSGNNATIDVDDDHDGRTPFDEIMPMLRTTVNGSVLQVTYEATTTTIGLTIIDQKGTTRYTQENLKSKGQLEIPITKDWEGEAYFVILRIGNKTLKTQKVVR